MTLRRMLAVTHETSITGAPINLLHLLRWITANTNIEVHTLALQDGPLLDEFRQLGAVTLLDESRLFRPLGFVQQGLIHLETEKLHRPITTARMRPQLRHLRGFDLVYINSLSSVGVLRQLPELPHVVCHVHELDTLMSQMRPAEDREAFLTVPDRWIACSNAVQEMLVNTAGLPPDKVLLHHSFIDVEAFSKREISVREIEQRRRYLRLPEDASVVVGSGALEWRKGPHLFVQLTSEVNRISREQVHFVWVGGSLDDGNWDRLKADLIRTGDNKAHFVGERRDPAPWFAMADVFALTSREDPYPLVCLEHAAMGHPIVSFRNGGTPELLEAAGPDAAACVVDYLDVRAMARKIVELTTDVDLAHKIGSDLRATVTSRHGVQVEAARIVGALEDLCTE